MGDAECTMRAHTVEEETFRKQIEDPLLVYDASSGSKVTERLVLRHAIDGTHGGSVPPPSWLGPVRLPCAPWLALVTG